MSTGIVKKLFTLWQTNITKKMRFAQGKCEIDTFQAGFCDIKLKIFIIFVSMATELSDHQRFIKKNIAMSKQIILHLQAEIWIMYKHFGKFRYIKYKIESDAFN